MITWGEPISAEVMRSLNLPGDTPVKLDDVFYCISHTYAHWSYKGDNIYHLPADHPYYTDERPLHVDPQPDNFAKESPIRAFTDWQATGLYALGKGFRPSFAHLTKYLDAMEGKEDWQLVQVLEAATGSPSFLFRRVL